MPARIFRTGAIAAALLVLALQNVEAREVKSSLGFSATIPANWVFLSREEVKQNPDLFDSVWGKLKGFNPDLVKQMREEIEAGRIELLFLPTGAADFRDNVNIRKQIGSHPSTDAEVKEMCQTLASELTRAVGQPVKIHECKSIRLSAGPTLFLEFTLGSTTNRTVQYQIARSEVVLVVATGTFAPESLGAARGAFETFVKSLKFQ